MKTVKATRFLKEGGEWVDRRWVHLERGETDRYRLGHESVTKGFPWKIYVAQCTVRPE